jgi:hypothetical protein
MKNKILIRRYKANKATTMSKLTQPIWIEISMKKDSIGPRTRKMIINKAKKETTQMATMTRM